LSEIFLVTTLSWLLSCVLCLNRIICSISWTAQPLRLWFHSLLGVQFAMDSLAGPRTQSVPALERGLLILECLAQSRRGVTLSQLVQKLQLPRSTGHALLLTYQRCGYVQRDERTGRYCLGFRLHALANMALNGMSLRGQAAPLLYQLMQDTGLTVHLAVMEEGEVILIDRIASPGSTKLATWVGKRMGLHCTALGKALIAHLPTAELEPLIHKRGLIRYNENTIASTYKLRTACDEILQLGYAIDDEEEEIGVRCVGAPVCNDKGEVVAAISISGSKAQLEEIPTRGAHVKNIAEALSRHLNPSAQKTSTPLAH
jgi:DNA-binding IclR family transcriptional regulator